jgi:hypothetical protein
MIVNTLDINSTIGTEDNTDIVTGNTTSSTAVNEKHTKGRKCLILRDKILNMCTINTTSRGFGYNTANITKKKVISSTRFCSIDETQIIGVLRRTQIIVFRYKHVGIRIVSRRCNIMDVSKEKIISRDLMEIFLGFKGVLPD